MSIPWDQTLGYRDAIRDIVLPGGRSVYAQPRPVSTSPQDVTDFMPGQADWTDDNLPPILYVLRPPPGWEEFRKSGAPPPKRDAYGNLVMERDPLDPRKPKALKDFKILPDRIGTRNPWWYYEAIRRNDPRVTWKDFLMRMPREGRRRQNALNMECSRMRSRYSIISWHPTTDESKDNDLRQLVLSKLSPAQFARNTTRGTTPGLINFRMGDSGGRIQHPRFANGQGTVRGSKPETGVKRKRARRSRAVVEFETDEEYSVEEEVEDLSTQRIDPRLRHGNATPLSEQTSETPRKRRRVDEAAFASDYEDVGQSVYRTRQRTRNSTMQHTRASQLPRSGFRADGARRAEPSRRARHGAMMADVDERRVTMNPERHEMDASRQSELNIQFNPDELPRYRPHPAHGYSGSQIPDGTQATALSQATSSGSAMGNQRRIPVGMQEATGLTRTARRTYTQATSRPQPYPSRPTPGLRRPPRSEINEEPQAWFDRQSMLNSPLPNPLPTMRRPTQQTQVPTLNNPGAANLEPGSVDTETLVDQFLPAENMVSLQPNGEQDPATTPVGAQPSQSTWKPRTMTLDNTCDEFDAKIMRILNTVLDPALQDPSISHDFSEEAQQSSQAEAGVADSSTENANPAPEISQLLPAASTDPFNPGEQQHNQMPATYPQPQENAPAREALAPLSDYSYNGQHANIPPSQGQSTLYNAPAAPSELFPDFPQENFDLGYDSDQFGFDLQNANFPPIGQNDPSGASGAHQSQEYPDFWVP